MMLPHGSRLPGCSGRTIVMPLPPVCASAAEATDVIRMAQATDSAPLCLMGSLRFYLEPRRSLECGVGFQTVSFRWALSAAGLSDEVPKHFLLIGCQIRQRRAYRTGR